MRYWELFEDAYHGSAAKFDKFSMSNFGSGEGAAVYGYGLYFASAKEVAEHYRDTLSGEDHFSYRGKPVERMSLHDAITRIWKGMPPEDAARGYIADTAMTLGHKRVTETIRAKILQRLSAYVEEQRRTDARVSAVIKTTKPKAPMYDDILKAVATADIKGMKVVRAGATYHVELPDDGYLLWDTEMSEQPDAVRAAVSKLIDRDRPGVLNTSIRDLLDNMNLLSGENFYKALARILRSQEAASEALLHAGIIGIKYLDGHSRGIGAGTYNYVVFTDEAVRVKSRE